MAKGTETKTTKTTAKPAKKETKEEKPKTPRGKTSYIFFSIAKRPEIVKANPDAKATEVVKLISEEWNKLTDEQKKPYNKLAEEDKERVAKLRAEQPKEEKKTAKKGKKAESDDE